MTNFTQYSCPNCGGELHFIGEGIWRCLYCGSEFTARSAEKNMESLSAYLDQAKIQYINDQRRNLYGAVHAKYINDDDVRLYATEIKELLPDDFQANFYLEALSGDPKKTARLIREINAAEHYELLPPIIHFLTVSLESEYHLALSDLIERAYKRHDLTLFSRFATALEAEAEKVFDGVYNTFDQRDVFIAYSSKDMDKVMDLCEALEDEGYSCFVAARNLRHGAGSVQNYDRALQEAMDNCSCFLFVSSVNSRSGSCDAVRKEIPYVKTMDIKKAPVNFQHFYNQIPEMYKMPRIEYRIDTDPSTSRTVTQFFDGYEWAYTAEEVMDRLEEILFRYTMEDEEWYDANVSAPVTPTVPVTPPAPAPQAVCEHKNVTVLPAVAATCTTGGRTESARCDDCGEILRSSVPTAPKGHRFGQWKEITPPTCGKDGVQERVCDCGTKEKKAIPAHGVHTPGEWQTEKEASEGVSGRKIQKCTVCGKTIKEETIPVLPVKQKPYTGLQYSVNTDRKTCVIKGIGTCKEKDVIIPTEIDGYQVTAIEYLYSPITQYKKGTSGFKDCTSVVIPNSVKFISPWAFCDCVNLTRVVIPDSVTSIGDEAFSGCTSLESVKIPDSVTSIEKGTFSGCTSLESVKIPDSVTSIEEMAFYGCTSLASVVIPKTVTSMGPGVFMRCSSLASVIFDCSVTYIDNNMFQECMNLERVILGDSVTGIRYGVFYKCKSLASICYTGKKRKWKKIYLNYHWKTDSSIQSVECSDGTIKYKD